MSHSMFMLAQNGDLKHAEDLSLFYDDNFIAQIKYDGVRAQLVMDDDGTCHLYTRTISKKTGLPVDKADRVPHLMEEFYNTVTPGTIIDGEVVYPGEESTFNKVTHILGSSPEKAVTIQESDKKLQFIAFDLVAFAGYYREDGCMDRYNALVDVLTFENEISKPYIQIAVNFTGSQKMAAYKMELANGGEGLMFKNISGLYCRGKRPHNNWIKCKLSQQFEVMVVGFTEAKATSVKKGSTEATVSRIAGLPGAIQISAKGPEGDYFYAGEVAGFSDEQRLQFHGNPGRYIGKLCVIEAQKRFDSGMFQNPRFICMKES